MMRGGGWRLGSQQFQSGESDRQRNVLICTRAAAADNLCVFRGKHFMTSPLNSVTSYYISPVAT